MFERLNKWRKKATMEWGTEICKRRRKCCGKKQEIQKEKIYKIMHENSFSSSIV